MTPEEKFNKQVWEILQEIKEEILATEQNKPVKYLFGNVAGAGIIPRDRQENIIKKLQELGALKIRVNPWEYPSSTDSILYLEIFEPKFSEVYKKYQELLDTNNNSSFDNEAREPVFRKNIFAKATYSTRSKKITDQFSPENRQ